MTGQERYNRVQKVASEELGCFIQEDSARTKPDARVYFLRRINGGHLVSGKDNELVPLTMDQLEQFILDPNKFPQKLSYI